MKTKVKSNPKRAGASKRKFQVVQLKSLSADEIFLSTLKEMGKPSLVREMAVKLKNGKVISLSKKKLMALLYASASHLNKDGAIKRTAENSSTYRYSLLEWKRKYQHKQAA